MKKETLIEKLITNFGANAVVKKKDILSYAKKIGYEDYPSFLFNKKNRMAWGQFRLPEMDMAVSKVIPFSSAAEQLAAPVKTQTFDPNAVSEYAYAQVPERDAHYVAFGDYRDIEKIVKSQEFFPVFISGLSGNGKTFMVEQACAKASIKMIRVQLSRETDEDDLMGGFRLINGETKFLKGPVLRAMELGALLLLDEADRADPGKIMCLQGVLEGKPYYVKKTGEIIKPAKGFNVIVTANTKGKGSDDGRYVSAGILDDAWLERFPITIEQKYPSLSIERKILESHFDNIKEDDAKFVEKLISWAEVIRKTFDENAVDEVISTRRLVHIVKTYSMFNDKMRAIELCINRFDEDTKTAFLNLYTKLDETIDPKAPATVVAENSVEAVPQN